MRFETSQSMRMGQHMKLAPRVIQSMEILQMPLAELQERIEQELASNATLELVEPGAEGAEGADASEGVPAPEGEGADADAPLRIDEGSGRDDFERLDEYESSHPDAAENQFEEVPAREEPPREYARARLDGEPDAKHEAMANAAERSRSLQEQLRDQWALAEVDERLRPLGELIIGFLDDDGALRTPLETIAERSPPDRPRPGLDELERAVRALQLFLEPPGVAARSARECLILQLDALIEERSRAIEAPEPGAADPERLRADLDDLRVARRIADEHLDDLAQNRLPRIAQRSGLGLDAIKRGIERLRRLSLAPARALVDDHAGVIIPDAIIEYDEEHDRYVAYLNDRRLPNVRVNREYALLARDRGVPKRDRDFLKTSLGNAQWLIDALEQRKQTLLRVIGVVVEAQREYFDYGPQALRPLPMTQVAEQLGIHVATVSRAVADKYVQTPRGVVPLRGFFTGGLATDSGEEVSYDAVRAALRDVVQQEDPAKPLSDEELVEELKKRGIVIARRTVAKYRDQLAIPPARLRKKF